MEKSEKENVFNNVDQVCSKMSCFEYVIYCDLMLKSKK